MRVSIIAALSENRVIGKDNKLPWHIPEDLRWFKKVTAGHPLIMGRKTFDSIGRPLPGRKNVIISRQRDYKVPEALVFHSLEDTIDKLKADREEEIFIIGGANIFKEALTYTDRIYLTLIHKEFQGDVFFPEIPAGIFKKTFEERHLKPLPFTFFIMDRVKAGDTSGIARR